MRLWNTSSATFEFEFARNVLRSLQAIYQRCGEDEKVKLQFNDDVVDKLADMCTRVLESKSANFVEESQPVGNEVTVLLQHMKTFYMSKVATLAGAAHTVQRIDKVLVDFARGVAARPATSAYAAAAGAAAGGVHFAHAASSASSGSDTAIEFCIGDGPAKLCHVPSTIKLKGLLRIMAGQVGLASRCSAFFSFF